MHATTGRQQFIGDRQRVAVATAASEDRGHELVVAERRDAMTRELFTRSIVDRNVSHYYT